MYCYWFRWWFSYFLKYFWWKSIWVSEDSQILSITWIDNDWTWTYSWVVYDNNWNAIYNWNHSWNIQSSVSSDFDLKQFNLTKGNYKFEATLTWTIWWENPENSKTLET